MSISQVLFKTINNGGSASHVLYVIICRRGEEITCIDFRDLDTHESVKQLLDNMIYITLKQCNYVIMLFIRISSIPYVVPNRDTVLLFQYFSRTKAIVSIHTSVK